MTDRELVVVMPASGGMDGKSQSIFLFLSLFLLVFAFFIVLVSISTLEEVKSNAVKDSLTSTFTTVLPPSTDPTEFTSKDGDFLAGQQFQEQQHRREPWMWSPITSPTPVPVVLKRIEPLLKST